MLFSSYSCLIFYYIIIDLNTQYCFKNVKNAKKVIFILTWLYVYCFINILSNGIIDF